MPTFVLMTKMSAELAGDPRGRKRAGRDWMRHVAEKCPGVKWIAHYALLGQYDFMDIYEAPDVETAHKVSFLSMAGGAANAESWHALPYDKYVSVVSETEAK
ncbi:MAG: GYD domain-containing protein [Deltaproteobacteria bacterium]|nr:GYD domain-containing protein [Deltaproteobacteria bacterium]